METPDRNLPQALGFLRLALLALAIVNVLVPAVDLVLDPAAEQGLWPVLAGVIAPVMAPLLTVVLLFEYIMSRVRAADAEGDMRAHYQRICRIELAVMGITLLFWVPFFIDLMA
jgi:hypothetical protein